MPNGWALLCGATEVPANSGLGGSPRLRRESAGTDGLGTSLRGRGRRMQGSGHSRWRGFVQHLLNSLAAPPSVRTAPQPGGFIQKLMVGTQQTFAKSAQFSPFFLNKIVTDMHYKCAAEMMTSGSGLPCALPRLFFPPAAHKGGWFCCWKSTFLIACGARPYNRAQA